jgi:hypothetical protein
MADLAFEFDWREYWVKSLLSEGRNKEAVEMAVHCLRAQYADDQFLQLVARLLLPTKRGRGRPPASPRYWSEIGRAFDQLEAEGMGYGESVQLLKSRFRRSERTVKAIVASYRAAKRAAGDE